MELIYKDLDYLGFNKLIDYYIDSDPDIVNSIIDNVQHHIYLQSIYGLLFRHKNKMIRYMKEEDLGFVVEYLEIFMEFIPDLARELIEKYNLCRPHFLTMAINNKYKYIDDFINKFKLTSDNINAMCKDVDILEQISKKIDLSQEYILLLHIQQETVGLILRILIPNYVTCCASILLPTNQFLEYQNIYPMHEDYINYLYNLKWVVTAYKIDKCETMLTNLKILEKKYNIGQYNILEKINRDIKFFQEYENGMNNDYEYNYSNSYEDEDEYEDEYDNNNDSYDNNNDNDNNDNDSEHEIFAKLEYTLPKILKGISQLEDEEFIDLLKQVEITSIGRILYHYIDDYIYPNIYSAEYAKGYNIINVREIMEKNLTVADFSIKKLKYSIPMIPYYKNEPVEQIKKIFDSYHNISKNAKWILTYITGDTSYIHTEDILYEIAINDDPKCNSNPLNIFLSPFIKSMDKS